MAITKGTGQKFVKKQSNRTIPKTSPSRVTVSELFLTDHENIDENNPSTLYFHIFGGIPRTIQLVLRGEQFNTNFYTELGQHDHGAGDLTLGGVTSGSVDHSHDVVGHDHTFSLEATTPTGGIGQDIDHGHSVRVSNNDAVINSLRVADTDLGYVEQAPATGNDYIDEGIATHGHLVGGTISSTPAEINLTSGLDEHGHSVNSGNTDDTGLAAAIGSLNTVAAKDYFNDLQIQIDGIDRTAELQADASIAQFGDGTSGHIIVTDGIELNISKFISTTGEHKIVFSLNGTNNGGKIRYNLYMRA